jgi:hypothetical protein
MVPACVTPGTCSSAAVTSARIAFSPVLNFRPCAPPTVSGSPFQSTPNAAFATGPRTCGSISDPIAPVGSEPTPNGV